MGEVEDRYGQSQNAFLGNFRPSRIPLGGRFRTLFSGKNLFIICCVGLFLFGTPCRIEYQQKNMIVWRGLGGAEGEDHNPVAQWSSHPDR